MSLGLPRFPSSLSSSCCFHHTYPHTYPHTTRIPSHTNVSESVFILNIQQTIEASEGPSSNDNTEQPAQRDKLRYRFPYHGVARRALKTLPAMEAPPKPSAKDLEIKLKRQQRKDKLGHTCHKGISIHDARRCFLKTFDETSQKREFYECEQELIRHVVLDLNVVHADACTLVNRSVHALGVLCSRSGITVYGEAALSPRVSLAHDKRLYQDFVAHGYRFTG